MTDLLRLLDEEQEILGNQVSHYRRRPRQTPVDEVIGTCAGTRSPSPGTRAAAALRARATQTAKTITITTR